MVLYQKNNPKRIKAMKKLILFLSVMSLFATTPKIYQQKLGLGIDVNWATFKKYVKHEYYKQAGVFKKLGFQTVRIRFTDPEKFNMTQKEYIEFLKKCVNEAIKNNLTPVLTYGSKTLAQHPTDKNIEKAVKFWREIAKTFKHYPDILSYDLYIEPGKNFNKNPKALVKFYKKAIKAIRKNDKNKIIFIAPIHASNPYYLDILKPIVKKHPKNLMIEWHYYAAGPSLKNKNKKWTTGTQEEKELITKKATFAKKWCEKYHLYSWVGAIMPGDYNKGDHYSYDEQKNFMKAIIDTQNSLKIPFAINADGQFYDYKTGSLKREEVLKFIINYYYYTK
ncbi:glycoside hydrolase family 5 protein [Caminibacter pacificus]|uniref:Glycoside hydrolase family 5 protein n=2 Tax=Caminibacter pacificus TaxID=1424653 RepID=A0ABX5TLY1_9BACT|nr:glycoside hydrolase family 5 protein [Caminibacter pacificus]